MMDMEKNYTIWFAAMSGTETQSPMTRRRLTWDEEFSDFDEALAAMHRRANVALERGDDLVFYLGEEERLICVNRYAGDGGAVAVSEIWRKFWRS